VTDEGYVVNKRTGKAWQHLWVMQATPGFRGISCGVCTGLL